MIPESEGFRSEPAEETADFRGQQAETVRGIKLSCFLCRRRKDSKVLSADKKYRAVPADTQDYTLIAITNRKPRMPMTTPAVHSFFPFIKVDGCLRSQLLKNRLQLFIFFQTDDSGNQTENTEIKTADDSNNQADSTEFFSASCESFKFLVILVIVIAGISGSIGIILLFFLEKWLFLVHKHSPFRIKIMEFCFDYSIFFWDCQQKSPGLF